jgi:hypothetical protein
MELVKCSLLYFSLYFFVVPIITFLCKAFFLGSCIINIRRVSCKRNIHYNKSNRISIRTVNVTLEMLAPLTLINLKCHQFKPITKWILCAIVYFIKTSIVIKEQARFPLLVCIEVPAAYVVTYILGLNFPAINYNFTGISSAVSPWCRPDEEPKYFLRKKYKSVGENYFLINCYTVAWNESILNY